MFAFWSNFQEFKISEHLVKGGEGKERITEWFQRLNLLTPWEYISGGVFGSIDFLLLGTLVSKAFYSFNNSSPYCMIPWLSRNVWLASSFYEGLVQRSFQPSFNTHIFTFLSFCFNCISYISMDDQCLPIPLVHYFAFQLLFNFLTKPKTFLQEETLKWRSRMSVENTKRDINCHVSKYESKQGSNKCKWNDFSREHRGGTKQEVKSEIVFKRQFMKQLV